MRLTWRQWAPFWFLGFLTGYIGAKAETTNGWLDVVWAVTVVTGLGPLLARWLSRHGAPPGDRA